MMGNRPPRNGDEQDAFSQKTRTLMVWNHGARGKIKTRARRGDRRSVRQAIRSGHID